MTVTRRIGRGDVARSTGLQVIFSFFLGLMLTAFIGIGVYTFHSPPDEFDEQISELNQREQGIRDSRPLGELTTEDSDRVEEIRLQRSELIDAATDARKPWILSTSIILIVFSTLTLAVSLVRAEQLSVISNGLLLGGVFTMLYGIGWIISSGTSTIRFLVMTVALAVTLGLGYIRFARRGKKSRAISEREILEGDGLVEMERRIRDLEVRMNEAGQVLRQKWDNSNKPE